MRTALILGLLVAVAGAATYAIVFGPELGLTINSDPVQGTTKAAAEEKPSAIAGISGTCASASLGPDSSTCKQCLAMKLNDCYGPPRPPSPIPTFDCAALPEKELPAAVAKVKRAVEAIASKSDAKADKDTAVLNARSCADDAQSYLRDRIKELSQADLKDTREELEKTATCLRAKHRVAAEKMREDTIFYERADMLGNQAIEMAKLARDLDVFVTKAATRLGDMQRRISVCGG